MIKIHYSEEQETVLVLSRCLTSEFMLFNHHRPSATEMLICTFNCSFNATHSLLLLKCVSEEETLQFRLQQTYFCSRSVCLFIYFLN